VDSLDQWRCFCILWGGGQLVELLGQHHGVDVESGLYNEVRVGESVFMYPSKMSAYATPTDLIPSMLGVNRDLDTVP
jgi:hypothetical protein